MKTTSLMARQGVVNFKEQHHAKIINVLTHIENLTYAEIAKYASLDRHAVARRLPELVSEGKIRALEPRKCSIGGRLCTTYKMA